MAQTNLYHNEQYRPRLCHLRRRADFPGYGFNLHCDKNTFGQYIGKVDRNSPAEAAGLRENDRIIEVNYVSVENESHKDVVARIKEGVTRNNTKYPDEVILLVVDQQTDEFYDKRNLPITNSDPNVQRIGVDDDDDDDQPPMLSTSASVMTDEYRNVADFTGPTVTNSFSPDGPSGRAAPPSYHDEEENEYLAIGPSLNGNKDRFAEPTAAINSSSTYMNTSASRAAPSPTVNGKSVASPLNMTAAEYRETLKEKGSKKRSVKRNSNMSMKDKIDFLNNWEKQ